MRYFTIWLEVHKVNLRNYSFRNFFKERVCQVSDTLDYARQHPYSALKKEAYISTTEFITQTCPKAIPCRSPRNLMDIALKNISIEGNILEFGVFKGESIKYIAKHNPSKTIHGFDSFEGLPESWGHNPIGSFTTYGNLPKVPNNVSLHKGLFDQTLPNWIENNPENISFLHVDCDLYSSTKYIFEQLGNKLVSGSVILFDDYFNFTYWKEDAHKVLTEYMVLTGKKVKYLGYAFKELGVVIK